MLSQKVNIQYAGGARYRLTVIEKDYKSAEDVLKNTVQILQENARKYNVSLEFTRFQSK